jgi:hypothetical protein
MVLEETIIQYALDNTFPIAVTVFLLYKDMKVNSLVTKELTEVSKTLAVICAKISDKK